MNKWDEIYETPHYHKLRRRSFSCGPMMATSAWAGVESDSADVTDSEVGVLDYDIGNPSNPLSDPRTALGRSPNNGGYWMGPRSATSPSRNGNVQTDVGTAAGVASILAGPFSGLAASAITGAAITYGMTADNVYYSQYRYSESSPTGATLETATVIYWYEDSARSMDGYLGRNVTYGSMTE